PLAPSRIVTSAPNLLSAKFNSLLVTDPVRLSIVVTEGFDPKKVNIGTPVRGKLLDDVIVKGIKVASKDDEIYGEISSLVPGKRTIKAYVPSKHWLNAQGRLSIEFHRIVTHDQKELTVNAVLRANTDVAPAVPEKLHRLVNKDGELTANYHIARYVAVDALIGGAVLATGPVGMIVAPAVTGVVGVVNPSYANGRPLESDEKTKPGKNFLLGAGRGIPGASLVFGMTTKGLDVGLKEGDTLELELKPNSEIIALKSVRGRLWPSFPVDHSASSDALFCSGAEARLRDQL
ncbi:MAG: hypothetical protein ACRDHZ_26105, partial [Ktedonobacteraceae bacterium]